MGKNILSIIIPVYNVEEYLRECLDSVFSQDLKDIEVICINDGSTDGSRAILKEYKDKYPSLIIIDRENGGLSAARNSGLKLASGKYIYFLDSDDYLLPNVLSRMVFFATKKELDVACFNSITDSNNYYFTIRNDILEVLTGEEYYRQFVQNNSFFPVSPVWMYIYRKEFLNTNNLFFKKGRIHEDELFTPIALLKAQYVAILNIPILIHRVYRPDALTTGFSVKNQINRIQTCKELIIFYKNRSIEKLLLQSVFIIYNSVAKNTVLNNRMAIKEIFCADDYKLWRGCVVDKDFYIDYFFFKYMPPIYKWYRNEKHPVFVLKIIKHLSRLLYSCSNKIKFSY